MSTIKAVRTTITLGDIELDVFQLPDGSYRYGYDFLASLIERDKSILSNKKSPYNIKALTGNQETNQKVKIDGIGYSYSCITDIDLMNALGTLSMLGHYNVTTILVACTLESIERRADSAFNVLRTEQERNALLQQRIDSKLFRRSFTDAIKEYPLLTGDNPNYGRITIYVYQKLGLYSEYLAWKNNPDTPKIAFRDTIAPTMLQRILEIEDLAAKLILNRKIEICKSIKIAAQTLGYLEY